MLAAWATGLIANAVSHLRFEKLEADKVPSLRTTKVPEGETILMEELNPDPDAVDSAISVYVQVHPHPHTLAHARARAQKHTHRLRVGGGVRRGGQGGGRRRGGARWGQQRISVSVESLHVLSKV
jgi:hypothetical protein